MNRKHQRSASQEQNYVSGNAIASYIEQFAGLIDNWGNLLSAMESIALYSSGL